MVDPASSHALALAAARSQVAAPTDVTVTLTTKTVAAKDPPWATATVCLHAVWNDPFQHVELTLPAKEACRSARQATTMITANHAEAAFDAAAPQLVAAVAQRAREFASGLGSCKLVAPTPITKLMVKVGDGELGPFEGSEIALACLPKQNLKLAYVVDGVTMEHVVSPAMCASAVTLPMPSPEHDGGPAGERIGSDAGGFDGGGSATVPVTVGLGLALLMAVVGTVVARRVPPLPPKVPYADFDLEVDEQTPAGYPVRVVRSPAGEARSTASPPRLDGELGRSLGEGRDLTSEAGAPASQTARGFGQALFDAIFAGDVRTAYDTSRAISRGLRIKLRVRDPELAQLPWELLYDARKDEYLALSRATPVSRYLELTVPVQRLGVEPPFRILGVVSTPADTPRLNASKERRLIDKAVSQLGGALEIEWLAGDDARIENVQQRLQEPRPWHALHYIGHGGIAAGGGRLAFTSTAGDTRWVAASELGMLVRDHPSLRLVVLNCCRGAEAPTPSLFASAAAQIARTGVPAVVAMQRAVTDSAAIAFADLFYRSIVSRLPIEAAVTEGRKAMSLRAADPADIEWSLPVLHLRSADGELFA